jgi:CheY-like chemotaxis protein
MVIVYADDEPKARRLVSRALQARGHEVFTLDTGKMGQLQKDTARLLKLIRAGLQIDVFVLDGHNFLVNEQDQLVIDMTPIGMLNWLYQNGLPRSCPLILFSNDNQMVWQASQQVAIKFAAAICKVGEVGGLPALLESIEKIGLEKSSAPN